MPRSSTKKAATPQAPLPVATYLRDIACQIKALEKRTIANVIEIGRLLEEASKCEHGEYMAWLKTNFSWSHDTSIRYRDVYAASQIPQIADFATLDISISALYRAAVCLTDDDPDYQAAGRAIIEAAKHGRVSCKMAISIESDTIEKCLVERGDIEPLVNDDELVKQINEAPPIEGPEPEYPRVTVNALFTMSESIMDLDVCLTKLTDKDWPGIISAVGVTRFREIVAALQVVCDEHCAVEAVPAKDAGHSKRRHLN
jgi:Protein of unknown function (DUF3102)